MKFIKRLIEQTNKSVLVVVFLENVFVQLLLHQRGILIIVFDFYVDPESLLIFIGPSTMMAYLILPLLSLYVPWFGFSDRSHFLLPLVKQNLSIKQYTSIFSNLF